MESPESAGPRTLVIDFARLFRAAARRKLILASALAIGLATGVAWQKLAPKRYTATISFVRSQTMDEAAPLGGLASLSLLGMGGQSSDPPLLKFIDKYLKSREFIAGLRSDSIAGQPLPRAIDPAKADTGAETFYGAMVDRIKVIKEAGLLSIKVWDPDPKLTVSLANLVYDHFRKDFDEARSRAIQENLAFANELVAKCHRDLNAASSALRDFLERNRGLGSPALEQARNELVMKERLAEERYLMAEKERGALEIKNERKEQSLVPIERPYLPTSPEYPKRAVTLTVPLLGCLVVALLLIGILDRREWIGFAPD